MIIITIDINSVVYLLISSKATGVAKILFMLLHKLGALPMAYSNKNSIFGHLWRRKGLKGHSEGKTRESNKSLHCFVVCVFHHFWLHRLVSLDSDLQSI